MRTAILLLSAICLWAVWASAQDAPERRAIHVIDVDQAITGATARFIGEAVDRAAAADAELLIIRMDTPGGLLEATRQIVQDLLGSPVPVAVFIAPAGARGASAGTMITMASHIAVMAPATHIGAAHPVSIFGSGDQDSVMAEKIVNDTSAFIESIAELRGRNVEWAISAVRESKSITAQQALDKDVVELIAEDVADLVKQVDGREVRMTRSRSVTLRTAGRPVVHQSMTATQEFISFLSDPNVMFLLLVIGLVGLYIELSNPGMLVPGITGAIALVMALIAMQTLPVSYGALGLMLLGIALLVAETFVPSFGVLGLGGLVSLFFGSLFLIDQQATDLTVSRPMIVVTVLAVAGIALVIGRLVLRSFRLKPRTMQDNVVGAIARVERSIAPDTPGTVVLSGELWRAEADESIAAGEDVVVREVQGLRLRVSRRQEAVEEQDAANGA